MYHSIDISGANTWDRWHLVPSSRPHVSPPEVKSNIVDLQGYHGYIDLSDLLLGGPAYGQRKGSWQFVAHPDYHVSEPWHYKYSDIMQYLHGKRHTVILEDDPFFYYEGRLNVNQWATGKAFSQITIDYTLQPFKKEIIESDEDWLWDPFSFVDGIIRAYSNIVVNGTYTMRILTGEEKVFPSFTNTGNGQLSITYYSNRTNQTTTKTLNSGETKSFEDLWFQGDGDDWPITFSGNSTVTVKFRGGWL